MLHPALQLPEVPELICNLCHAKSCYDCRRRPLMPRANCGSSAKHFCRRWEQNAKPGYRSPKWAYHNVLRSRRTWELRGPSTAPIAFRRFLYCVNVVGGDTRGQSPDRCRAVVVFVPLCYSAQMVVNWRKTAIHAHAHACQAEGARTDMQ